MIFSKREILRVWGQADGIELKFVKIKDGEWDSSPTPIPIDYEDGQYVVTLYAEDSDKRVSTWNGILYITNGFSHLHIKEENFVFWLLPEKNNYTLQLKPQHFELILKEECDYHGT